MTEIEQLLLDLLAIPSPTGQEADVANFVMSQLSEFKVEKQPITADRFNVVAIKGTPKQWLVAHLDTVPGNEPIKITEEAIFGRGACDNKQSVAGAILAGRELQNIGLLFTIGEEQDFCGAKRAQAAGIGGDLVIVQEPTQFKIVTGQRGVITCTIVATGRQQHSAQPSPDSATHKLIKILNELAKHDWPAYNVGTMKGGVAENVVAPSAEATLVIRSTTPQEHSAILENLEQVPAQVIIKNNYPPFDNQFGFPSNIGSGFAETAFFKNSLKFGAGNVAYAHSDREHISREELNKLPHALIELLHQATANTSPKNM